MKAITITLPDDLDQRTEEEAHRRGISKSELIRQGLGTILGRPLPDAGEDPWRSLAGFGSAEISVSPGEIDDLVYR